MSLLPESDRPVKLLPAVKTPLERMTCWEFMSCSRVLCPAYGQRETSCWLIPRTPCHGQRDHGFIEKLPVCLECPYFKAKRGAHPKGWNHFLAEELYKYNLKFLEQIYQKEESYIEILNRIPDGLFTIDQDKRITYFNPAAERITGFSAHDAVGMFCKDVFKSTICLTDCALKHAGLQAGNIHNREFEITTIDGRKVPVLCSTSLFVDDSGRVLGGLEIFKDMTEFERLQMEVIRREKKYRRIFEGSHDMIYTSNERGRLLDVNLAGVRMLRYRSKSELLGIGSAQRLYLNNEDRDRFLAKINHDEFVKDYEVDFKAADGSPVHVLISARRYESPDTGDIEYEGIIKDITQRKQTEEVLRKRNQELSLLNSVAVALNMTLDLKHILLVTLKEVMAALYLKRGAIFVLDQEKNKALMEVQFGLSSSDHPQQMDIRFKDKMLEKHLLEEDASVTPEPTFPSFQIQFSADPQSRHIWLYCFLITFKGKGVGFFALDIPPSRFLNQHELHLLGSLGNFLGGAIENAQLMKTISRHRQELRRLTAKLFKSHEMERRRIAQDLHDEAGQALTAVKLGLDRLEERVAGPNGSMKEQIGEIRKMLLRTTSEIRRLSHRLHPTLLSDLGLEPALHLYFKEIAVHANLDIDFHMVGFDQRIQMDMETVLYRFSQETLTNTIKHANADNYRLFIIKSYPKIIFIAEDDGVGFNPEAVGFGRRSLGLLSMRERVSLLGGTFHMRSEPGRGTRIRIEIPFQEEEGYGSAD